MWGSSKASSPLFQYLFSFDSLPLFSVTVGPWVPQHTQVCLKPPQPQQQGPGEGGPRGKVAPGAAADGGSTALPFPAVCWGTVTNPPAPGGQTVLHPSQEIPATAKLCFSQPS